jgi:hypothetical protein
MLTGYGILEPIHDRPLTARTCPESNRLIQAMEGHQNVETKHDDEGMGFVIRWQVVKCRYTNIPAGYGWGVLAPRP